LPSFPYTAPRVFAPAFAAIEMLGMIIDTGHGEHLSAKTHHMIFGIYRI